MLRHKLRVDNFFRGLEEHDAQTLYGAKKAFAQMDINDLLRKFFFSISE